MSRGFAIRSSAGVQIAGLALVDDHARHLLGAEVAAEQLRLVGHGRVADGDLLDPGWMMEVARRRGLKPAAGQAVVEPVLGLPQNRLTAASDRFRQHDLVSRQAGSVRGAREERRHREGRGPDTGARVRDEQQHGEPG